MRLENKVTIVTGAGSGQGKVEAELFAKEGAKIIITDINYNELCKTKERIKEIGAEVLCFHHDISSEEDWKKIIHQIENTFGKLDVLVNNAGILKRDGLLSTTLNQFTNLQSVNTIGTFLGMKHAAKLMKKSGGGSIVNISSIYGLVGSEGSIAYHASKGAIRSMSKSSAIELSKYFIRVNSIYPGVIITPMSADSIDKKNNHPLKEATPLPYLGKPEDVAFGALFLASDESVFVTGSELTIDGGYTAK